MVSESVCLADMIILDMFQTHIGWKGSRSEIFRTRFQGNLPGKWLKIAKMAKIKPFLALLSSFCHFEQFSGKVPLKPRPKNFRTTSFPFNMSSKHVQNDHINQTNRLEYHSYTFRALPRLLI